MILTKADENLKCIMDALGEKNYTAIRNPVTHFGHYVTNLPISNGIFFIEDKMVIPMQLGAPIMARFYRGHAGLSKMTKMMDVATNCFWWPHMNSQIQVISLYCKECIKSGENLKSVITSTEIVSMDLLESRIKKFNWMFWGHCHPLVVRTNTY